jgi:hypothetical protein
VRKLNPIAFVAALVVIVVTAQKRRAQMPALRHFAGAALRRVIVVEAP